MRKPAHGGGRLKVGNPGNKGGPGRPASRVREAATLSTEKRLHILEEIADGKLKEERMTKDGTVVKLAPPIRERRAAVVDLATIGMGTRVELDPAPSGGWNLSFNVAPTHPALQPPTAE